MNGIVLQRVSNMNLLYCACKFPSSGERMHLLRNQSVNGRTLMRFFTKAVLVTAVVLLPTLASAQALAGIARDASGAVLPGVTVEAASPVLIEKVRTATTDGTGTYSIVNLTTGVYTVTFTFSGFTVVRREGVEVSGAQVITINADLRVGGVQETITVTGETPVVDEHTAARTQKV